MTVINAGEKFDSPKFSIFLAGPTPRSISVESWRPDFINALEKKGFKSSIYAPENRIPGSHYDFDKQIPWEVKGLNKANLVVFWIPRKLDTMPALTTNIEFGEFMHSNKIVVGFPPESVNNRYIGKRCKMHKIPLFNSVDKMVKFICKKEREFLNQCNKCSGTGQRDSNGRLYNCSLCKGTGQIKK